MSSARRSFAPLLLVSLAFLAGPVAAQIDVERDVPCCNLDHTAGVVYIGDDSLMTGGELMAYLAPILWFSPDEPLLRGVRHSSEIRIPTSFPFEEAADKPVVYYRLRNVVTRGEELPLEIDHEHPNSSVVDLSAITTMDVDFFFYYPSEEGLGAHMHDVESVEMKVGVYRQPNCSECRFGLKIEVVTAKAHGILWYDNTLDVNADTRLPITILVEEGKHASCTDSNGDGYYTPGYDVTRRVNDAWGVRDVMRTGALYSGGFNSWFAKNREDKDRVFPPLPPDSPAYENLVENGEYAPGYAKYELRPFPDLAPAEKYAEESGDHAIVHFVDKGYPEWPYRHDDAGAKAFQDWLEGESFVKSLSIAARFDNNVGVSFVFPLFVVKGFNEPVGGGWIMNRMYLKDTDLRDFGWQLLYSPSASRWIDTYFAAGVEWDREDNTPRQTAFATETGLKFRFNVGHSPLKFMTAVTDFWGFRAGIRYKGYKHFSDLGYVIEVGAGTF